jgi:phasin family protein
MLQRNINASVSENVNHFLSTSLELTMALTADQFLAAQKANLETLFGLTTKAFEGVEKLVELNVTASKAALSEAQGTAQALLSVKDAQELLALQASLFQPLAEKTTAYSRHLYDIAQGTGAEFTKAFEAKAAETQATIVGLVDSASKNAPAGSETAVAMMKSAVAAANNAFESVQKAVKQASDVAEANFTAVSTSAVNAAKSTAQTASRKR